MNWFQETKKRLILPMPTYFRKIFEIMVGIFGIGAVLIGAHKAGTIDLESYKLFGVTLLTVVTHIEAAAALAGLFIKTTVKPQVPNQQL